jgi:hypothetical protein
MKSVVIEVPSTTGYVKATELINVHQIEKCHCELPQFSGHYTLAVHMDGKTSPYILGYIDSRDKQEEIIRLFRNKEEIYLDLVDFFTPEMVSSKIVSRLIPPTHNLKYQLDFVHKHMAERSIAIALTDAFRNILNFEEFMDYRIPEEWARIWAKTLAYPIHIQHLGINKYQFYAELIKRHNETFSFRYATRARKLHT